jgi:ferredoxin/coenzyme F420-reducing hydrogenase delta subunit
VPGGHRPVRHARLAELDAVKSVRSALRQGFERIETRAEAVFDPTGNPLRMLGALGWLFFWIVVTSGIYLYIFFDTGVHQAYRSVEYLTHTQWYLGGVMRSLHRYASDALVVVVLVHLTREFAFGRFSGARWLTWLTGIPLLWLMFAAGISGYWMVWDRLAQYLAIATTEWFDTLPLFGESIARNFLHNETLSGRFFTLMVFIHIAVPLCMLFLMWIHVQRLALPNVNPPPRVALGTLAMLLGVSALKPALSQGPADLDVVVGEVGLDWFYLGAYPLLERYPGELMWLAAAALTFGLLIVPWTIRSPREGVAVVNLDNCNGCARCFMDCPFGAITMGARTDDTGFLQQAVVDIERCVACGICVGACPTSTPFRRRSELVPGIDLAMRPMRGLRNEIIDACAALSGEARTLTFVCAHGPETSRLDAVDNAVVSLNCIGMLPPSFIDFILMRDYADGIVLAGCSEDACYHRLGIRWTEARLGCERDPYLRRRLPRTRILTCWSGMSGRQRLRTETLAFKDRLRNLDSANDASAN